MSEKAFSSADLGLKMLNELLNTTGVSRSEKDLGDSETQLLLNRAGVNTIHAFIQFMGERVLYLRLVYLGSVIGWILKFSYDPYRTKKACRDAVVGILQDWKDPELPITDDPDAYEAKVAAAEPVKRRVHQRRNNDPRPFTTATELLQISLNQWSKVRLAIYHALVRAVDTHFAGSKMISDYCAEVRAVDLILKAVSPNLTYGAAWYHLNWFLEKNILFLPKRKYSGFLRLVQNVPRPTS